MGLKKITMMPVESSITPEVMRETASIALMLVCL